MSPHRLTPHPRYEDFLSRLMAAPALLVPWTGTLFRFHTVSFPEPRHILSGQGARLHGGRWNPPGLATLYGSTTDTTALAECKANDRYYGIETKAPRLLVAIEVRALRLLNLTSDPTRSALGASLDELLAEDWRKRMASGQECLSQALGRACAKCGASGLLVRSASVPRGLNGVIFPGGPPGDRLRIIEGDSLARLTAQTHSGRLTHAIMQAKLRAQK